MKYMKVKGKAEMHEQQIAYMRIIHNITKMIDSFPPQGKQDTYHLEI